MNSYFPKSNNLEKLKNNSREIFLSISSKPGSFGETVHNAGYSYQGLNYFYKAIKVVDLKSTIKALRFLEIRGCSVSMPYKEIVLDLIDQVDGDAQSAGAVNTILNENGILKGFNTDIYGAGRALDRINITSNDSALILGVGGVARAVILALQKRKVSNILLKLKF